MRRDGLKLLLIGPYPPPHGGVSVHVKSLRELMEQSGIQCRVLNLERRAAPNDAYIKIGSSLDFAAQLLKHAWRGWTLHLHTNGHNRKSWLIAFACALAGLIGPGCRLTLHSGLLPEYLRAKTSRRVLAFLTCLLCDRIICVNEEIKETLKDSGVSAGKLEVKEAYLGTPHPSAEVPEQVESWIKTRSPLLTTTMFDRPEYGYDVLRSALAELRKNHPSIGCVVMGIDRASNEDGICHAGDVGHSVCMALMSRSDVFVRPTLNDGDSISVREACNLGIPVVASNVGTRPSGVHLFDPGDVRGLVEKIEECLKERSSLLRHEGRQHPSTKYPEGSEAWT